MQRLRAMSLGEIAWRMCNSIRTPLDQVLIPSRTRHATRQSSQSDKSTATGGFPVTMRDVGWCAHANITGVDRRWLQQLRERATRSAAGHLSLFDMADCALGDPIDWNRDPKHGVLTPRSFAPAIDYRDFTATGDAKFVWEPNRHHHLVVLARAYRATGRNSFARAAADQWEQWLNQCPFGMGMNWRSPLELAIRLINWVWTLDLIRPSDALKAHLYQRLLAAVYLHMSEISRNYSRGSSANNHRIGEAAGVFIASHYFQELPGTRVWQVHSREILCEEILKQTYSDGGSREHALGYHLFVLQFFALAGLVARRTGEQFPPEYWERLRRMFEFIRVLSEGGDTLPMFGDSDDGYVLDLDADPHDVRHWLSIGGVLFNDPRLKACAGHCAEACQGLFSQNELTAYQTLATLPRNRPLRPTALRESGYYILQCGRCNSAERISVFFDCAPLGYGSLAAHGHADALSFTLRAFGRDVFVDPGTYDYFTFPEWRTYFRGTRAHNTVVIDDQDQSVMLGPFLWGERAKARCLKWEPTVHGGCVLGEHDGYGRLPHPLIHRRLLELKAQPRELCVEDELITDGSHTAAVCFHLAEHCRILRRSANILEIDAGAGGIRLELDPKLSMQLLKGSEAPRGGWVSRGYHRKTPSLTIIARCTFKGSTHLRTRILIGKPGA